ncbi:MAG: hypothetical protein JWR22_4267 [Herminiimonas sp.]|nr:hypothetical protein [Herminiimonas sp.]
MKILVFIISVTATIAPVSVLAAGDTSAQFARCIEKAEAVDPKILDCMSTEWERQDKRLNEAYKKLFRSSSSSQKTRLQQVQRLWVKYTEANCGFYYDPEGGTSARQSAAQCAIDARVARAKELEGLIKY